MVSARRWAPGVLALTLLGQGVAAADAPSVVPPSAPDIAVETQAGSITVRAAAREAATGWFFVIDGPSRCTTGQWQVGDPIPVAQPGCAVVRTSNLRSVTFEGLIESGEYRVRVAVREGDPGPQSEGVSPFTELPGIEPRPDSQVWSSGSTAYGSLPQLTAVAGARTPFSASFVAGPQVRYEWDVAADGVIEYVGAQPVIRFPRVGSVPVTVTGTAGELTASRSVLVEVVPLPNSTTIGLRLDPLSVGGVARGSRTNFVASRTLQLLPRWNPESRATRLRLTTTQDPAAATELPLGHQMRWRLPATGSKFVVLGQFLDRSGRPVSEQLQLKVTVLDTAPMVTGFRWVGNRASFRKSAGERLTALYVRDSNGRTRKASRGGKVVSPLLISRPGSVREVRVKDAAGNIGPWISVPKRSGR